MEYIIFLKLGLGLSGAILAALIIWYRKGGNKIERPLQDGEGNYLVAKPENTTGIVYDEEITLDENQLAAIKDPKGTPKGRPQ
jgi:hypothetical protein